MTTSPKILYVAPRPARPSTSGQVIMHRHLTALGSRFALRAAHTVMEPAGDQPFDLLPLSAFYLRLSRTRWRRWTEGLNALTGFALPRCRVAAAIARHQPDLLLVVAESPVFIPTLAAARRARLPVVTIVHDWSTVWLDMPRRLRAAADRVFLANCRRSTLTLSVSPELAAAIGPPDRHRILYPIPGNEALPAKEPGPAAGFRAIYAGVFHYFHNAEMADLCSELLRSQRSDLLRIHGPEPDWTSSFAQPVRTGSFYAGLIPRPSILEVLSSAGALLVICPFGDHMAPFSRYSFPSKLTEYCRFGRPIVLWGPQDSAALHWAASTGAALPVTDRNPAAVVAALLTLERDAALRDRLGEAARREATTTFHPDRLQSSFETALREALAPSSAGASAHARNPAHGH